MKKSIKNTIISLALSAAAFCFLGGVMPFMNKTNASATTVYSTLDGFTIEETAAVRTKGFNGIRFTTNLSAETMATVNSSLTNVQYGTLLLPADMLGVEELTHETAKVVVSPAEIWQDEDTYTAVLAGKKDASGNYTDLPDSYYNRPIVARSYVTGKDSDGNTVTYYSENTAKRSIGYVATMAKLDGNTSELVGEIADDSKVELVFDVNEQISAAQGAQNGTVIIENKYDGTTDKAATIKVGGISLSEEYMTKHGVSVSYETTAPDVISVNGQTLTANTLGEATITATATFNGKSLSASKTMLTNAYRGQSEYKILISEAAANGQTNKETGYKPATTLDANAAYQNAFEKTAAYKLQSILEEATGVRLEIVTNVEAGQKYISVGKTELSSAIDFTVTKDTGYEVVVDGDNILICGLKEQGTLYGVQNLLKELVGYNFFMEDTYTVNSNVEVVLSGNQSIDPDLEYNVLQGDLYSNGVGDEFAIQMYIEGVIPTGTSDWEDANGYGYKGIAHNTVFVLNEGAYNSTIYISVREDWKKWYATKKSTGFDSYITMDNPYYTGTDNENTLVDESKKTIKAELCYTAHGDTNARNAMIEEVASQMFTKMQTYPAYERIGFAQMDHRYWCECIECKKANPSDNLLEFLLDVAANLKTKLANADDARAETFQICSLFYHATAATPKNTANYASKISTCLKHVEPWLCDSGMDHVDPYELTDAEKNEISSKNSSNNWNATMYDAIKFWGDLCKTNGADLFFWDYYQNTTSFFIPYNVFDTLRRNYGTFAKFEYDYVFSQMMESKQNFARFKEFLVSKLKWNANPTDAEWNGWYQEYFEGAYGPGAAEMREYFNKWDTWTTSHINDYRRDGAYDWKSQTGTAALAVDMRTWTDKLTAAELESWITSINNAIDALDISNPNYDTYRRNIMLEKLTPMYLLMWMHDGYTPVKDEKNLPWPYIDPEKPGSFNSTTYVNKYGAEFLTWVAEWNIIHDGEGDARVIKPFLDAIKSKGVQEGDVTTNKVIEEKQFVEVASATTFNNAALANETYTVSGGVSGTVTAKGGVVTLNTSALTVGQSYELTFTNTATGGVIVFTNVVAVKKLSATAPAVSGQGGYYLVDNTYYVEEGKTQLTLTHKVFTKGDYTIVVGDEASTASTYIAGKLTVEVGVLANGQSRQVICVDANNNSYEFKVVSAKFIRTAEELKALGVGQNRTNTEDICGYYVLGNDITFEDSDIVTPGYPKNGDYYFKGTFDGNGYALKNMHVSDGGIFGLMRGATVKNLKLENVYLTNNPPSGVSIQNGGYSSILAFSAPSSTFENITMTIAAAPNAWSWKRDGLLVCSSSWGAATFRNITIDACGLTLNTLLGISHSDKNVYENVVIKAANYVAIGYTADSYNNDVQNTAALMGEFPAGVTFKKVTKVFEITNTETSVGLGGSLAITTSQPSYSYTYALKEEVNGVSISGNTVAVSKEATLGETFTVVVAETEGCVREITFKLAKASIAVSEAVTIEQVNGSFVLPSVIEEDILSVSIDGYAFANVNGLTVTFGENELVKQQYLGKGKTLLVETATSIYQVPANVYTMIIDNKAEFDGWETVAANNSVKAGVVIEEQKYAYLTGYFVLGADIAYNGVWTPALTYAATSGKYGTLYGLCNQTNNNVKGWIEQYGADKVIAVNGWTDADKLGFHGTFDGDGYVIDGMRTEGKYSAFTVILGANGAFKNLAFTNASVGAGAALLFNRGSGSGSGTLENIYVELVSMESGSGDDATTVYGLNGQSAKNVKNVIVDASNCDFTGVTGAYLVDVGPAVADGVYVIGANGLATTIKNITAGDVAASFASMEALLNDATHGAVVSAFDASFWTVDTEIGLVVPNRLYASRAAVELADTLVIEKWNNSSFTLPEEVKGTVTSVKIGTTTLTDINGRTVSFGENDFVAQTELGKGKPVFITTQEGRNYTGYANVYTMIIDSKAELNQWQAVAAENAVKAGICLEVQKGFAYNGYFLLNANIEYNGVWTPYKTYGQIWALYGSDAAKAAIFDANGNLIEGAINEDWGAGNLGGFKGVFDGDGHYINGIQTASEYSAFVVTMGGGTIKNVAFTNAVIGSRASVVVDRGTGSLENVYVQVKSMASGTVAVDGNGKVSGDATVVLFRNYNSYNSSSIKNVLVDVSLVDYASLKGVYIASLATHPCNLYVIGMPEGINFSATTMTVEPLVFQHHNPNSGNTADFDLANCFVSAAALLNDETYGADVKAWSNGIWNVTYKNEIFFGDLMVYDGLETVELDDVVEFSVEEGKLSLPSTIEGTVTSVKLLGMEIFAGMDGNKVLLDCAEIATDYTVHGLGKNILITTDTAKYVLKANVITKFIKTAEELKALGAGGNTKPEADIEGYYVLGNDITFSDSDLVAAGYPRTGEKSFKGTFDGRGYTLYNMQVSDGGIFGYMDGTVKNFNIVNVVLTNNPPSGASNQNGGYIAILAHGTVNGVFENINITVASAPSAWTWKRDGLLVNTGSRGAGTFRNIAIDATGLTLNTLLGISHNNKNVYENVVIKAADYVAIGYTGDSYNPADGKQNTAVMMNQFPAGVTLERAYLIMDCAGKVLPLYTGDVTSLGFPAGTEVHELTYPGTTNAWDGTMAADANQVLLRKAADQDYASIQFVLGRDFAGSAAFFTWVHYMSNGTKVYKGGGQINKNGTSSIHTEAINAGLDLSYFVFETKTGALVTASNPMKAGVAYTLYAYCTNLVDVELSIYDQSGAPMTIYFANISSGYVTELAEELVIGVEDGNFVLPTGVEGNVKSILLNGNNIFTGMDGAKATFNKSLMPTAKADLGNKEILIYTDAGIYRIEAVVATQIIRTTQELRDLGVGGKVYTDRKPTYNNSDSTDEGAGGNANSGVAGNDKTGYYLLGNDLDFTGEQSVAAGYCWQQSWFKGVFDGNGYTIYGISVNEGGIFGSLRGATIKNVNFVGVVYNINLGNYAGQYSQQTALFAHVSDSSTFENINVTVASVIPGNFGWATLAYTFWNTNTLTNINFNASGIALSSVLGSDNQSKVTYNNVTVQAASYTEIGKKGSTVLTEFPEGVTFVAAGKAFFNDNSDLPLYEGDVTAIGFEKGTEVRTANITNGWSSRAIVSTSTMFDYVDIEFVIGDNRSVGSLCVWDGVAGNYNVTPAGGTAVSGAAERIIQVFDVNGNAITAFAANTRYILRVYTENVSKLQVSTFDCSADSPAILYFGNVTFGNDA